MLAVVYTTRKRKLLNEIMTAKQTRVVPTAGRKASGCEDYRCFDYCGRVVERYATATGLRALILWPIQSIQNGTGTRSVATMPINVKVQ